MNNTFSIILKAALAGARCPTNDQLGAVGRLRLSEMAKRGDVLIEVYQKNFRRVTILTGPHKGKHTLNPPLQNGRLPKPYLVVNAEGTFCNGKEVDYGAASRGKPSPPGFAKRPTVEAKAELAERSVDAEPFHHLKPWQPHEFRQPNALPSVMHKLRGGRA